MVFQIGISAELKETGKKEKSLKDEDPQGMNASYRKDGQAIDIEYTDYTDNYSCIIFSSVSLCYKKHNWI